MNKEMICKNCKYHYIEEISFDYPQSCCSKRNATTEGWCKCNAFEYSDRYIEQLQQENKKLNGAIQTYDILLKVNGEENKQLKDNWNKLKEYLINDINDRNGTKIVEFEEGNRVSETISPIYTLMEDKSRTMKEVLDKMQELEQGSDSNEKISKITG